jgi:(R,R)-butanediol dehydrogenase/meso-butanediol dehydrogenase/diacetyl reductase
MRAVEYHGPGDVRLVDRPAPAPGPGDLLVKVGTAGICGSDVGEYVHDPLFFPIRHRHPHSGHAGPTVAGHEFSGWVEEVGEGVTGFEKGDLVAVGAGVSCGTCPACVGGNTNMCASYWTVGLHADGGLAERVVVPASCTIDLSGSSLTADLAALVQPMAIAVHATRRGRVTEADRVLILGSGGIGSFITHAAAHSGATVTTVDLDPAKLAVARSLGATRTLDATAPDLEAELAAAEAPTVVFECTARPESLTRALGVTAENGRLVLVGHQPEPVAVDFKLVSMGEREIIGTMAHVFAIDVPVAVEQVASNPAAWVDLAPTVFPLDAVVPKGLEPMSRRASPQIKVLFDPSIDEPRPLRIRSDHAGSTAF